VLDLPDRGSDHDGCQGRARQVLHEVGEQQQQLVAPVVSTVVIVWAVAILRAEGRRGRRREPGRSGHVPMRGAAA